MKKILFAAILCGFLCHSLYAAASDVFKEVTDFYVKFSHNGTPPPGLDMIEFFKVKTYENSAEERKKFLSYFDFSVMLALTHGLGEKASLDQYQRLRFYVDEIRQLVDIRDHNEPLKRAFDSFKERGFWEKPFTKDQITAYLESLVGSYVYRAIDNERRGVPPPSAPIQIACKEVSTGTSTHALHTKAPISDDGSLVKDPKTVSFEKFKKYMHSIIPLSEIYPLLGDIDTVRTEGIDDYLKDLRFRYQKYHEDSTHIDREILERGNTVFRLLQSNQILVQEIMHDCLGDEASDFLTTEMKEAGKKFLESRDFSQTNLESKLKPLNPQEYYRLANGFSKALQEKDPNIRTILQPNFDGFKFGKGSGVSKIFTSLNILLSRFPISLGLETAEFKGTYLADKPVDFVIQLNSDSLIPIRALPYGEEWSPSWNGMGTILAQFPEVYFFLKTLTE